MRLETEFRLCVERQQLELQLHDLLAPKLAPSTWVKLRHPLAACCSNEALLLCSCSDSQWLAWIPDYGEIMLDVSQIGDVADSQ